MKIKIENWGPIKEYEYDLSKEIIITYGDNNIGKSYAMQIVYILLKYLIEYAKTSYIGYSKIFFSYSDKTINSELTGIVVNFATGNSKVLNISDKLEKIYAITLEKNILQEIIEALKNTFGTYEIMAKDCPVVYISWKNKCDLTINFHTESIGISLNRKPIRLVKSSSEFHKSRNGKDNYDIYVVENHVHTPRELLESEMQKINRDFSKIVLQEFSNVYYLPASRSGIYAGMSSFGPIMAQLSQNRARIRGAIQIPSIPEPISDYYMMLSDIHTEVESSHAHCANEIERNVLKGEIMFDKKKKSLAYRPYDSEFQLDLQDTSSMVSEIAPITAFLKYIVRNTMPPYIARSLGNNNQSKVIIFIEEPEAHLHPKNQVLLIKAFTKLALENVTLVMASHSNYIFNQMNNMILERKLNENNYLPILLRKIDDNRSRSEHMPMDEFGVDDDNFADISNELMDEREKIIEKIMEEHAEE